MPPPDFTEVAKAADLAPGARKVIVVDGERYVLVNLDSEFAAILDECGHASGLLSKGKLEGDVIVCPRHFARYDFRTGALVDGPPAANVPVCEVEVEDGAVYLKPPAEICSNRSRSRYG